MVYPGSEFVPSWWSATLLGPMHISFTYKCYVTRLQAGTTRRSAVRSPTSMTLEDSGTISSTLTSLNSNLFSPTLQRHNIENPGKGIAGPRSQFPHSCVCERFLYSHDRSAYSATGKYVDRSWEYINRSQTHECGNREWGRAIPFPGMHKWDFICSVQELHVTSLCLECSP
jgi:hypothetical protein